LARQHYLSEVSQLILALNKLIPEGQPHISLPDNRFHRSIGEFAGKTFSTTGELLSPEAYAKHMEQTLPTAADKAKLAELYKQPDWVLPV
jgi:hypothetical protein